MFVNLSLWEYFCDMKRILYLFAFMLPLLSCRGNGGEVTATMPGSGVGNTSFPVHSALQKMFVDIGRSAKQYSTPDDWEFLMMLFCNDLEGADMVMPDSGYNWFSVCGEYSSRSANFRNPRIRYRAPYNMIESANTILDGFGEDLNDSNSLWMMAQARALRAWSYMLLAPDFQFNYQVAGDMPCVPIITQEPVDYTNNPRASVRNVYNLIIEDLNYSVDILEGLGAEWDSRPSKMYIDKNVAHGLRARAYLDMGEWQKACDDAECAAQGYKPATLEEVSKPSFYDIDEHNWIWGYDMTPEVASVYRYATTSSWLRSFSGWGYVCATQCYSCINKLLYDKIPENDIRKQWWVDEDLNSTLLDGLVWPGFDDVANADDGGDTKLPYIPYTNVKFGCYSVGTEANDEDMPLMRVEEMILIQAECKARMGDEAGAKAILENFVNTYRMASGTYSAQAGGRSILDEIWFQRRVELWGEGFGIHDTKRLDKPLVRFHDDEGNIPAAFRFNLPKDDPWLLMRFPEGALNENFAIIDNTGGHQPVTDENPGLRDGVTD